MIDVSSQRKDSELTLVRGPIGNWSTVGNSVAESVTNDKNCLLLFLAVQETVSEEWFRYLMRIFNAIG